MKICPNCRTTFADNAAFCDRCGNRLAEYNPNVQQPNQQYYQQPNQQYYQQPNQQYYQQPSQQYYQQPSQQYYQQPNQQYYQPVAPQAQPRKKNTGLIIGLVAAALILLAIIGMAAEKLFQSQGYGDSGSDTGNSPVQVQHSYTKGTLQDGYYVNPWANIRMDTSGWTEGSASDYALYADVENTDCGLILNDINSGSQVVICYEVLAGVTALMTENGYLDVVAEKMGEQYDSAGLSYSVADYYNTTIAGSSYRTMLISLADLGVTQCIYVRKLDGRMISIIVSAQAGQDPYSVMEKITAAN